MSDSERQGNGFFSGLVLGALLGAGLFYFLTSTEKGQEIRKELEEKGEGALDNLGNLVADIEKKSQEFKEKAAKAQIDLEKEVKQKKEKELSQIKKLQERGRKAVKFFTRNGKSLA